ncbi:hypothetical protein M5J15_01255 [Serratia symbiotica]|uniref:hypothetical protein n=1 Tax=Serratia symbiotica TaxID=138074 RepID=UPI0020908C3A|nr:hypothetical protein [Serratia symbiotica]USS95887.1 hypothetical protein M5J15_01255 [Serratia symbiotica]
MSAKKVLGAFCHELGCNVTIDDARRACFALEQKDRKRFRFSCSDRHCNVTMSGVNYHVKAEDGDKFKAAHLIPTHQAVNGISSPVISNKIYNLVKQRMTSLKGKPDKNLETTSTILTLLSITIHPQELRHLAPLARQQQKLSQTNQTKKRKYQVE